MNILSLNENNTVRDDANIICKIIKNYAESLREAKLGKKVKLDGVHFELFRSDRNTIYRINSAILWYLKMPRIGCSDSVEREISGAKYIKKQFNMSSCYYHARSIRASAKAKYLLCAEIPGVKLNMKIYSECIKPRFGVDKKSRELFRNFGRVQAKFHHSEKPESYVPTNRNIGTVLSRSMKRIVDRSSITDAIQLWAEEKFLNNKKFDNVLIHANLHPENVLICRDRMCFIDFENFGVGSIYEDISQVVSHLTLTKSLIVFPWKRIQTLLGDILSGYKSVSIYNSSILYKYVTARICIYYLQRFCSNPMKSKIAGIPVKKEKLEWMIRKLIREEYDAVFQFVRF